MILTLIIALLILLNLLVELTMVGVSIVFLVWELDRKRKGRGFLDDMWAMGAVLLMLLVGHLVQMALWAGSFIWCGEFDSFQTAFYHSSVNYASLGYGDIVMSEEWRLLGGLEAAVGVMMFGVSAALLFAMLSKLIRIHFVETLGWRPGDHGAERPRDRDQSAG
ncbi:MAG: ion channel [Verrucomicrobiota bacterium]